MKKLTLLFFALFPLLSIGQINFEPGYFISNNGVKTECLIKNWDWRNNPKNFEYVLKENEPINSKSIAEVSEFKVSNNYKFIRFNVKIDKSSEQLTELSDEKEPEWSQETQFLKVLVEGDINLYLYQDNASKRFFTSAGDHKSAEQLVYKEYLSNNQQTKINKNNQFKNQLYILMKDANLALNEFKDLEYKESSLVDIAIKYNQIKNPNFIKNVVKENKGIANFKLIAGANFSSFQAENSLTSSINLDQKTILKIGLEFEYNLPFNKNKWSLFIDPNYQSYKAEQTQSNNLTRLEYNFIEIPIGFRHYFFLTDTNKSRIFADAGYAFSFNLDSKLIRSVNQELDVANQGNLFLGIGYSYSKYSIEFRYSLNKNLLAEYSYWTSDYKSYGFSLGYKFL